MISRLTVLALTFACITGCDSVKTTEKVGIEPASNMVEWDGTWRANDGAIHISEGEAGKLDLAWIEHDKEDGFEMKTGTAYVRKDADHFYVNLGPIGEDTSPGYSFMRVKALSETVIILWGAQPRFFAKAVDAGELEGKVVRNSKNNSVHVVLTATTEKLTDYVRQAAQSEVWAMDQPLIMKKLTK